MDFYKFSFSWNIINMYRNLIQSVSIPLWALSRLLRVYIIDGIPCKCR